MSSINRNEIVRGNLWQLFFRLSAPGMLGMLLVSFNGLTDAFFVSHFLGEDAFTGVSLTLPLFVINSAVTGLLASGASVLYSRLIGSGEDEEKGNWLFQQLLLLVILASVLLALFSIATGSLLLRLLGAEGDVLKYGREFYITAGIGNLPSLLGLCVSGLLRAGGQLKRSMQITAIAVVLNIVLNPVFIRVFGLGTKGAALASVCSMSVYAFLAIRSFLRGHTYRFSIRNVVGPQIKDILLTGLPAFFMQVNGLIRQFVLFKMVTFTAAEPHQVSFFAAVYRLFSFAAIPVFGILQALQPVIGINYGAKQYQRVKEAMFVFRNAAITLMLLITLIMTLFSEQVLLLLIDKTVLLSVPVGYFCMVLLVLPFMPLSSTGIVLLQATGMRRPATIITLLRELLLFIPVMAVAVCLKGYAGIYYGLLVENILYSCCVYILVRHFIKKQLAT